MAEASDTAKPSGGLISKLHQQAAARHAAIDTEIEQKRADHKAEVAKLKDEKKKLAAVLKAAGHDVAATATGAVDGVVKGAGKVTEEVAVATAALTPAASTPTAPPASAAPAAPAGQPAAN